MNADLSSATTGRTAPQTGEEFLESLRDGREVWVYGERIDGVTTHPAFRNSARSLAALFDELHANPSLMVPTDTGSGGLTHPFFRIARTHDDLRAGRDTIAAWQRLGFGFLGRTPDYKAALLTALGSNPEYFGEYADNARNWYRRAQEEVLHIGHAIVHPPVDRARPIEEVRDVYVHVERETDAGIIVSGAKVVATGAPTSQYVYVSQISDRPVTDRQFAITFIAPLDAPGVKLFARASYEDVAARTASPFDQPLSSRLDENDAILVFDEALIPWENVLVYDVDTLNRFDTESGWTARAILQASTRLGVKLDFLAGALSLALEVTGAGQFRGVQAGLGEVVAYRNAVNALRDGQIERAEIGWGGQLNPHEGYGLAYAAMAPGLYRRIREIVESVVASGLIYLNSHAVDFQNPEVRPYLDRFLRGSNGRTALDRSRIMKLLWDGIGSEFGARHELYELNYFGQPEVNFIRSMLQAEADGVLPAARELAETALSEYDLDGWTRPEFITPTDVSVRRAS